MTEFSGNLPSAAKRHIFSRSLRAAVLNSGSTLPTGGGDQTTIDSFLFVAHDAAIDDAFISVQGSTTVPSNGVITMHLIQLLRDGGTRVMSRMVSLNQYPLDTVILGGQIRPMLQGLPVYLRMEVNPSSDGNDESWWDNITYFNLSLHLLSTR